VIELFVRPFSEEQALYLASMVSVDKTNYSVSFNEFLKLMSMQQEMEPDEETLIDVFV
jgi:Ca2+-binding EF-hand superfamily protein